MHECRRASLVIAQQVRRGDELLLDAEVRVAALDASGFRPRGLPEALYNELKPLESQAAAAQPHTIAE